MSRIFLTALSFLVLHTAAFAQQWPNPEVRATYEQGRGLLSRGSFPQAILAFTETVRQAPGVMEGYRELGHAYFLSGKYKEASKTLGSIIRERTADEAAYQVAAASLAKQKEYKKARKVLRQGIGKYPKSGLLYHELGQQHEDQDQTAEALQAWLAGIRSDPAYRINYFDAARLYLYTREPAWALLYAEQFLNMEFQTARAADARKIMIGAYKRLYQSFSAEGAPEFGRRQEQAPATFIEAVAQVYQSLGGLVADGYTVDNLIMLRTRFLLRWQQQYAGTYPHSLFAWHRKLVVEGNFDVYNQWLLGSAVNPALVTDWQNRNPGDYQDWEKIAFQYPYRPEAADSRSARVYKKLFPPAARKR